MKKLKNIFRVEELRKSKRETLVVTSVILGILIIAAGVTVYLTNSSSKKNQELSNKVDSLNNESTTCQQVIDQLGQQKADGYDLPTKQKLLERQFNCYADLGDDDKTLETAQELRAVYEKQEDKKNIEVIDSTIDNIKNANSIQEQDAKNTVNSPVQ